MKILYVCHRFPFPPKRGGKIRPFNMIRHLGRAHEVTVVSLVRSAAEADEGRGIAPYCHRFEMARVGAPLQALRMVARLPTTTPSSFGYFRSTAMASTIDRLLAEQAFDLVFVHCSSVARYVEQARGMPKILDFGDMDSQKWLEYGAFKPWPLSVGYRLEGHKLAAEEKRLARAFDLCTTTTRAEWETLQGYATGAATDWFPNGVDSDYFAPDETAYDADTLSFVGRMDYFPNQDCMFDFCRTTFPLIRAARPQAQLVIVGADPSPAVRALAAQPGVTVTGSVPDVRAHLRRSAVMVAPLRIARGTQNKILEAMAAGVPVVTSSVAAGGVDARAGEDFVVADGPAAVAAAVLRLMDDPGERARVARAGRERVLTHHAWEASMRRLDGIIARCVASAPRAPARARATAPRAMVGDGAPR
ncbi:MAG TPA: TIGR03087 family PEP-CTERM/XrtA system glycosyltransferase [Casimicrobiaceae bacterium]|nr:TIGR03087 family PEP-CTERM/XrtA system glycosyltransferase [Casimicrobiaceae bacterium]